MKEPDYNKIIEDVMNNPIKKEILFLISKISTKKRLKLSRDMLQIFACQEQYKTGFKCPKNMECKDGVCR